MEAIIKNKLAEIEAVHGVRILYACESGSRAWGFPSPDSDYDVRFIYVHSQEQYLRIDELRDVIELPINEVLDINGWELRKALRLFRKSNGPIFEWLQSPIIYQRDSSFHQHLLEVMPSHFNKRAMMHHYLSMTNTVMKEDLSGDELKLKKYFYVLRPLLACLWMITYNQVPPMEFDRLRELLSPDLNDLVDELLAQKLQVNESHKIKPLAPLHHWLREQLKNCEAQVPEATKAAQEDDLNRIFRKYLL
jgi:predicted nucleotidyltransferase